jgi:hypothetical protein
VFPKVTIHVFIGSRAAALADGEQRDHMDTREYTTARTTYFYISLKCCAETKLVNSALIIGGTLFTIFMSWWAFLGVSDYVNLTVSKGLSTAWSRVTFASWKVYRPT